MDEGIKVTIYTDGASKGNPGPGGYGTILMSGQHSRELSAGYALTTNNRMELLAVIAGLEALKKESCNVTVFSDSKYVVDAVEKKWVESWYKNKFKNKKNKDLWLRYLNVAQKHCVKFVWVKGHDGNIYNERCDRLAVQAAESANLEEDTWYIQNIANEENIIFNT
ncbi:MAG: ribonuclease HI [Prevotellaceae bacterium]|jgi:ribonuclease HI|nr:ribonuclease HI [Prevotellaceae bacterium]